MMRNPPKAGPLQVLIPIEVNLGPHAKHPFHIDRIILQLCRQASPKELFALKGIRTLDRMKMPPRPRHVPLDSTPFEFLYKPNKDSLGHSLCCIFISSP